MVPAGQQVRLTLDARVNYPYWCANNSAMVATVNGKPIVGADLLNKPLEYHCKNGRDAAWASLRGSSWQLFSWPDFDLAKVKAFESPYSITETDPFHFVWDITPYVKAGSNTLAFTHPEIIAESDHYLVLRNVVVEVGQPMPSQSGAVPAPAPTGPLPSFIPRGKQRVAMTAEVSAGGSIRLRVGSRTMSFTTRTGEPEGKWVESGQSGWKLLAPGKPAEGRWAGTGYAVRRKVTVLDDHIAVTDTFTNTGDGLVGVMYEHALALGEPPLEIKLGGRPPYAPYQADGGGTNPTALVRWPDLAVGMVAEDDVFRVHCLEFASKTAAGLADHSLGLAPGASQTIEWSIYPVPRGDYWDFINAVRRNWGANFTLPGLHVFVPWSDGQKPDEYYRQWVTSRGVTMVTPFDAMFDNGKAAMGTAIPLAKAFCDRTRAWIGQLHRVAPQVKTLFYMNATLCTEPGAPEKYADSRLVDASGNQLTVAAGGSGGVTAAPNFISTLDNSYGRAMMDVCKWIVNDLGADGLYHDVYCSYGYGVRAYGNAPWDGCTVDIDPQTHAVIRKASVVALLQRAWHVELVRYLRAHGKTIIGNCPVETRTELDLHMPIFVETGFSFSSTIETHLGAPWAYGNNPQRDPSKDSYYNYAYALRRLLDYGGLLAVPTWNEDPTELTFLHLLHPITPLEIREGMIIGEERIVTARSGLYGWPDGQAAQVYVFDGDGRLVTKPPVKELREGGRMRYELRMPGDWFAILVRK